MNSLSKFLCLSLSLIVFWPTSSDSALILKVKDNKALIYLQGVHTQKGAFFRIYNMDNNKRGLLKIDRVAQTKAIGTLKVGSMSKKWNLEPVSKRTALMELKKASQNKQRQAMIHREKLKRRLARKKAMQRKQRLANKKRALSRKVASYSLEENVLEGLDMGEPEEEQHSDEILSYSTPSTETTEDYSSFEEKADYPTMNVQQVRKNTKKDGYFQLGLNINPQFNLMKAKPNNDGTNYNMTGLGSSIYIQALLSSTSFLDISGMLGYRYFSVSTPEGSCPQDDGCSLLVHHLAAMGHLKFNLFNFNKNTLWFSTETALMIPIAYRNRVPNLKKEAFESLSLLGTIGAGVGIDFKVGHWILPLSLNGSVIMPISQTTLILSGGLQTGFRYQF